jgi:hypothetical protein
MVVANKGLNATSNPNSFLGGIVKLEGEKLIVSLSLANMFCLITIGLSVGFSIVTNLDIDSLMIDYNSILASG